MHHPQHRAVSEDDISQLVSEWARGKARRILRSCPVPKISASHQVVSEALSASSGGCPECPNEMDVLLTGALVSNTEHDVSSFAPRGDARTNPDSAGALRVDLPRREISQEQEAHFSDCEDQSASARSPGWDLGKPSKRKRPTDHVQELGVPSSPAMHVRGRGRSRGRGKGRSRGRGRGRGRGKTSESFRAHPSHSSGGKGGHSLGMDEYVDFVFPLHPMGNTPRTCRPRHFRVGNVQRFATDTSLSCLTSRNFDGGSRLSEEFVALLSEFVPTSLRHVLPKVLSRAPPASRRCVNQGRPLIPLTTEDLLGFDGYGQLQHVVEDYFTSFPVWRGNKNGFGTTVPVGFSTPWPECVSSGNTDNWQKQGDKINSSGWGNFPIPASSAAIYSAFSSRYEPRILVSHGVERTPLNFLYHMPSVVPVAKMIYHLLLMAHRHPPPEEGMWWKDESRRFSPVDVDTNSALWHVRCCMYRPTCVTPNKNREGNDTRAYVRNVLMGAAFRPDSLASVINGAGFRCPVSGPALCCSCGAAMRKFARIVYCDACNEGGDDVDYRMRVRLYGTREEYDRCFPPSVRDGPVVEVTPEGKLETEKGLRTREMVESDRTLMVEVREDNSRRAADGSMYAGLGTFRKVHDQLFHCEDGSDEYGTIAKLGIDPLCTHVAVNRMLSEALHLHRLSNDEIRGVSAHMSDYREVGRLVKGAIAPSVSIFEIRKGLMRFRSREEQRFRTYRDQVLFEEGCDSVCSSDSISNCIGVPYGGKTHPMFSEIAKVVMKTRGVAERCGMAVDVMSEDMIERLSFEWNFDLERLQQSVDFVKSKIRSAGPKEYPVLTPAEMNLIPLILSHLLTIPSDEDSGRVCAPSKDSIMNLDKPIMYTIKTLVKLLRDRIPAEEAPRARSEATCFGIDRSCGPGQPREEGCHPREGDDRDGTPGDSGTVPDGFTSGSNFVSIDLDTTGASAAGRSCPSVARGDSACAFVASDSGRVGELSGTDGLPTGEPSRDVSPLKEIDVYAMIDRLKKKYPRDLSDNFKYKNGHFPLFFLPVVHRNLSVCSDGYGGRVLSIPNKSRGRDSEDAPFMVERPPVDGEGASAGVAVPGGAGWAGGVVVEDEHDDEDEEGEEEDEDAEEGGEDGADQSGRMGGRRTHQGADCPELHKWLPHEDFDQEAFRRALEAARSGPIPESSAKESAGNSRAVFLGDSTGKLYSRYTFFLYLLMWAYDSGRVMRYHPVKWRKVGSVVEAYKRNATSTSRYITLCINRFLRSRGWEGDVFVSVDVPGCTFSLREGVDRNEVLALLPGFELFLRDYHMEWTADLNLDMHRVRASEKYRAMEKTLRSSGQCSARRSGSGSQDQPQTVFLVTEGDFKKRGSFYKYIESKLFCLEAALLNGQGPWAGCSGTVKMPRYMSRELAMIHVLSQARGSSIIETMESMGCTAHVLSGYHPEAPYTTGWQRRCVYSKKNSSLHVDATPESMRSGSSCIGMMKKRSDGGVSVSRSARGVDRADPLPAGGGRVCREEGGELAAEEGGRAVGEYDSGSDHDHDRDREHDPDLGIDGDSSSRIKRSRTVVKHEGFGTDTRILAESKAALEDETGGSGGITSRPISIKDLPEGKICNSEIVPSSMCVFNDPFTPDIDRPPIGSAIDFAINDASNCIFSPSGSEWRSGPSLPLIRDTVPYAFGSTDILQRIICGSSYRDPSPLPLCTGKESRIWHPTGCDDWDTRSSTFVYECSHHLWLAQTMYGPLMGTEIRSWKPSEKEGLMAYAFEVKCPLTYSSKLSMWRAMATCLNSCPGKYGLPAESCELGISRFVRTLSGVSEDIPPDPRCGTYGISSMFQTFSKCRDDIEAEAEAEAKAEDEGEGETGRMSCEPAGRDAAVGRVGNAVESEASRLFSEMEERAESAICSAAASIYCGSGNGFAADAGYRNSGSQFSIGNHNKDCYNLEVFILSHQSVLFGVPFMHMDSLTKPLTDACPGVDVEGTFMYAVDPPLARGCKPESARSFAAQPSERYPAVNRWGSGTREESRPVSGEELDKVVSLRTASRFLNASCRFWPFWGTTERSQNGTGPSLEQSIWCMPEFFSDAYMCPSFGRPRGLCELYEMENVPIPSKKSDLWCGRGYVVDPPPRTPEEIGEALYQLKYGEPSPGVLSVFELALPINIHPFALDHGLGQYTMISSRKRRPHTLPTIGIVGEAPTFNQRMLFLEKEAMLYGMAQAGARGPQRTERDTAARSSAASSHLSQRPRSSFGVEGVPSLPSLHVRSESVPLFRPFPMPVSSPLASVSSICSAGPPLGSVSSEPVRMASPGSQSARRHGSAPLARGTFDPFCRLKKFVMRNRRNGTPHHYPVCGFLAFAIRSPSSWAISEFFSKDPPETDAEAEADSALTGQIRSPGYVQLDRTIALRLSASARTGCCITTTRRAQEPRPGEDVRYEPRPTGFVTISPPSHAISDISAIGREKVSVESDFDTEYRMELSARSSLSDSLYKNFQWELPSNPRDGFARGKTVVCDSALVIFQLFAVNCLPEMCYPHHQYCCGMKWERPLQVDLLGNDPSIINPYLSHMIDTLWPASFFGMYDRRYLIPRARESLSEMLNSEFRIVEGDMLYRAVKSALDTLHLALRREVGADVPLSVPGTPELLMRFGLPGARKASSSAVHQGLRSCIAHIHNMLSFIRKDVASRSNLAVIAIYHVLSCLAEDYSEGNLALALALRVYSRGVGVESLRLSDVNDRCVSDVDVKILLMKDGDIRFEHVPFDDVLCEPATSMEQASRMYLSSVRKHIR